MPKNMKGRYLTDEKQFKIQEDYCRVSVCSPLPRRFADVCFAFTAEPGKTCEAFYGHKYTGSDGNTYHSPESYQAIHYDTAGNQTVRSHNGGGARATLWLRDDSGERQVMCIESGVDYGAYENYEMRQWQKQRIFSEPSCHSSVWHYACQYLWMGAGQSGSGQWLQ